MQSKKMAHMYGSLGVEGGGRITLLYVPYFSHVTCTQCSFGEGSEPACDSAGAGEQLQQALEKSGLPKTKL